MYVSKDHQRVFTNPAALKNKKAQIGETMTWVVATIVIIAILITSLYITAKLAESKKVIHYVKGVFSEEYERTDDLIMEKSIFSYFLVEDEEKKTFIYDQLRGQEFHTDFEDKFEEIKQNLE